MCLNWLFQSFAHVCACKEFINGVLMPFMAVPQAAMSRGVQHASPLVGYATLCALRQMLDALSAALSAAAQAADSAGGSADVEDTSADTPDVPGGRVQRELAQGRGEEGGGGGNARAWQAFLGRLRSAARARLPDLQALLALHASLDGLIRRPPPPGAAADAQVSALQSRLSNTALLADNVDASFVG